MFFGKHAMWRLLSPLVALLWVVATVGFARSAAADATADHGSGAQDNHASAAQDHADAPSPDTSAAAGTASTDHPTPAAPAPPSTADHGGASGDTSQPQPISNADANAGGANGQCPDGPYCSTRDGSASANGNGGGKATGEPCAGCVGKADNKNPRGQMPGPADHNAGNECDTNHGIAQGNPAHTGCLTTQPGCVPADAPPCVPGPCVPADAPPCVPGPCVPADAPPCAPGPCVPADAPPCAPGPCVPADAPPCVPTPDCVPADAPPCVPSPPSACVVTPVQPCGTQVEAPILGAPAPAPAAAGGPTATLAPSGVLPETGAASTLLWLATTALGCLLAGAGLLAHGRRRATRLRLS